MTGKELRAIRQRLEYTIDEFSRLLGVSWITLWRKETGKTGIPYVFSEAVRGIEHNRKPFGKPKHKKAA